MTRVEFMIDAYCDEEAGNWKAPAWLLKKVLAT